MDNPSKLRTGNIVNYNTHDGKVEAVELKAIYRGGKDKSGFVIVEGPEKTQYTIRTRNGKFNLDPCDNPEEFFTERKSYFQEVLGKLGMRVSYSDGKDGLVDIQIGMPTEFHITFAREDNRTLFLTFTNGVILKTTSYCTHAGATVVDGSETKTFEFDTYPDQFGLFIPIQDGENVSLRLSEIADKVEPSEM